MASDHIPDAGKRADSNEEVIRWRSCEEDPPDTDGVVLLVNRDRSGEAWRSEVDERRWFWANGDNIENIKGCLWAEMPRGPK